MPIEIDSVFYELALHDKDFAAALRTAAKNLDAFDQGTKKADAGVTHLQGGINSLQKDLKRMAEGLAIGLAVRAFIGNTVEAQNALAQLQAALRSTGGAAGFTLPELEKMSTEMSKLSIFSDEAVKGGLARLLTYTGIQGPMFREAARATLDFATALRIDVNSAAERVGNALQYPTEAINSLTKQGFRFTSEQKRLIAAFESTGQLAKAQAIILAELDLAYRGSAEAARNTLGGALSNLKNQFMETLEVSQSSSGGIIGALNSIADAMPGLRRVFDEFFTQLNLGFIEMGIGVQKADIYLARFQLRAASALSHVPGLKGFAWNQANQATALLGTDQGKGLLDALDKLKAQSVAETLGRLGKSLTDAQHEAQKNARAAFAAATAGQRPESASAGNFESQVKKLVAAAQQAHIGATEIQTMVKKLQDAHAQALKGLTDAQIQAQKNARAAFEAATAAASPESADNFESMVAKLEAAAKKARLDADEIRQRTADLRKAHADSLAKDSAKLADDLQSQLAQVTVSMRDDLEAQLHAFDTVIAEAKNKGLTVDPALVERLRDAKVEAIALAPKTEAIALALDRIDKATTQGFNLSGALTDIGALIESATAIRDQLRDKEGVAIGHELEGSLELRTAQERLLHLIEREAEIRKQIRTINLATANESQRFAINLAAVAGNIANIANVAFGLASAFSGANSELTKMLAGTAQVAGGISSLGDLAGKLKGGFGELFSTKAGILSALPGLGEALGGIVGIASSVFSTSPEEQERRRLLKENSEAIRHLTERVGDLAKISVSGTQVGQFGAFLANPRIAALLGDPAAIHQTSDAINRQIGSVLDSLGLSAQGLKEFAKSFGITVGTGDGGKFTLQDIKQLMDALNASELNQFADDFAGQMQRLDAQIKLFDLTKPIDQFEAFRKVLATIKGGSGALGNLLKGFDLTTAAGIDAARKAVQDLFTQFQTLPQGQLAGFLGGLTPQEFLDAIQRATDFINAQAGSGGVLGTGGFNVSRTITETTGNRLEALSSTGNVFAEQTARNTALIAQLLGGNVGLPVINPPATSSAAFAGVGTTVVFEGGVHVTVSGVADPARARQVGEIVSDAMIAEIDRKLAGRLKWNNRARGIIS